MKKNNYLYINKFFKFTGISFLINTIWISSFLYIANSSNFVSAFVEKDATSILIVKSIIILNLCFIVLFSLFCSILAILMYYAQKENLNKLKLGIVFTSLIVFTLMVLSILNFI